MSLASRRERKSQASAVEAATLLLAAAAVAAVGPGEELEEGPAVGRILHR